MQIDKRRLRERRTVLIGASIMNRADASAERFGNTGVVRPASRLIERRAAKIARRINRRELLPFLFRRILLL